MKCNEYVLTLDSGEKIHVIVPQSNIFAEIVACVQVASEVCMRDWSRIDNMHYVCTKDYPMPEDCYTDDLVWDCSYSEDGVKEDEN